MTTHKLFRNTGDGTFADVSEASGITAPKPAGGLGVALVDLDGDGRADCYVANVMRRAFGFGNGGGGTFEAAGGLGGAAMRPTGRLRAGMAVAAGEFTRAGGPAILVSAYQDEPTMVFLNQG